MCAYCSEKILILYLAVKSDPRRMLVTGAHMSIRYRSPAWPEVPYCKCKNGFGTCCCDGICQCVKGLSQRHGLIKQRGPQGVGGKGGCRVCYERRDLCMGSGKACSDWEAVVSGGGGE